MHWARFHPNKGKYHAYPDGGDKAHDGRLMPLGTATFITMCNKNMPVAKHMMGRYGQTEFKMSKDMCVKCVQRINKLNPPE